MTDQPWVDESERRLMIRAVARMSNDCEMPALTPECPFFEIGSSGPECAEQCRDLMDRYPEDHILVTGHDLGFNLDAVPRPRPRRAPRAAEENSFDARRRLLTDVRRPLKDWTFTSVLLVMRDLAAGVAVGEFADKPVTELIDTMRQRGVDPDVVVPAAFSEVRASRIAVAILSREALIEHLADDPQGVLNDEFSDLIAVGQSWTAVLCEAFAYARDIEPIQMLTDPRVRIALGNWFRSRGAVGMFADDLPSSEQLRAAAEFPAPGKVEARDGTWMLDRFTNTYLHEWSYDSLLCEHRYLHSKQPGCVPSSTMKENHYEAAEIARMIAHRASEGAAPEVGLADDSVNVGLFTRVAVERLNAGKSFEAIAIYRALAQLKPNDPDVANNLGFCQLMEHPGEAVETLRRSLQQAGSPVTAINLALAHHRLGENVEGLRHAVSAYDHAELHQPAFMWALEGDPNVRQVDLGDYLDDLVAHIEACGEGCMLRIGGPESRRVIRASFAEESARPKAPGTHAEPEGGTTDNARVEGT